MKQADLISERRNRAIARPRQAAMWLAKQLTTRSLPDIGRRFGGRDHTTVLHAVRRIEAAAARDDPQLAARPARLAASAANSSRAEAASPPACVFALISQAPPVGTAARGQSRGRSRSGSDVQMQLSHRARRALLKALGHVQSVVERRNTIPILSNVLLSADRRRMALSATDLDMEIIDEAAAAGRRLRPDHRAGPHPLRDRAQAARGRRGRAALHRRGSAAAGRRRPLALQPAGAAGGRLPGDVVRTGCPTASSSTPAT